MEDKNIRLKIKNFSFDNCKRGNQGFKRLCIQIFGYVGHGKSSFINTCKYVWDDTEYKNYTKAADTHESHTTERLSYPLTSTITLVDNRGCATMNSYETGEIFAQLGNLLPLGKSVSWSKGFALADRIVEAESIVEASDFILPVFVYSVVKTIAPGEQDDLKELLLTARKLTGIFPIVVLTHKNDKNLTNIKRVFKDIGTERTYCLENYTQENHVKSREIHKDVIGFLHGVIEDTRFWTEHQRDPEKEMIERKVFVLKYIHEKDLEKAKNEVKRLSIQESPRVRNVEDAEEPKSENRREVPMRGQQNGESENEIQRALSRLRRVERKRDDDN